MRGLVNETLCRWAKAMSNDRDLNDWKIIEQAPKGVDIQLAVINRDGISALIFPCKRMIRGWENSITGLPVSVLPTHWRPWRET